MDLNTFLHVLNAHACGDISATYYVSYCTFHGSFKLKYPVRGAKVCFQYVKWPHFYYIALGTYCCIFIIIIFFL